MQRMIKEGVREVNKPYTRLLEEISKREIKHKAIQKELGIAKCTLSVKLHGSRNANFSLEQAIAIQQKFFPDVPIEELFKR